MVNIIFTMFLFAILADSIPDICVDYYTSVLFLYFEVLICAFSISVALYVSSAGWLDQIYRPIGIFIWALAIQMSCFEYQYGYFLHVSICFMSLCFKEKLQLGSWCRSSEGHQSDPESETVMNKVHAGLKSAHLVRLNSHVSQDTAWVLVTQASLVL